MYTSMKPSEFVGNRVNDKLIKHCEQVHNCTNNKIPDDMSMF